MQLLLALADNSDEGLLSYFGGIAPILILLVVVAVSLSRLPKVELGHTAAYRRRRVFNWLPLGLTLWELHQGRMATRELLWQFQNQATIFARASSDLQGTGHEDAKAQIYVDLAERSLFETYLWTIHRFHREFSPPSGG